ncbi:PilW family protein [uncultured Pseudomonas sp.]|uniref:PilW family protein n=1 Tax=uncultured Pseudomonas sp. TaxID=114707 RepID=UPI0025E57FF8|nr:PilW family protein [uncultured Pseudomonas sp.]
MRRVSAKAQRGLSIIELMIALLLGLLLMGGVLQLFLSSKRTYLTNAALSQVQESGRFALEFLAYDLRNAGYRGECLSPLKPLPTTLTQQANGQDDLRLVMGAGIQGWSTASNAQNPANTPAWLTSIFNARANGSDVILLKHAADAPTGVVINGSTTSQISTTGATGLPQNRLLVIDDPSACFLFANQSGPTDSNVSVGGGQSFGRQYRTTAHLLLYQSAVYYLRDNGAGIPSLWRQVYYAPNQPAEELVGGIQQLQIRYAVGQSSGQVGLAANGQAYQDASTITDWQSVIAAQISLIAVSNATNVVAPDQQVLFNNAVVTIPNGRLAQVFTLTVSLRNHLP